MGCGKRWGRADAKDVLARQWVGAGRRRAANGGAWSGGEAGLRGAVREAAGRWQRLGEAGGGAGAGPRRFAPGGRGGSRGGRALEDRVSLAPAHPPLVLAGRSEASSPPCSRGWRRGHAGAACARVSEDGDAGQSRQELRLPAQVPAGGRQRCGQGRDPGEPAGRRGRIPIRLQQR